ncbi:MAG TPA: hypothetical protein VLV78_13925 [Thermoanaerobaculia bacterium]|nr:hypothetical protein [Thermoanaerobaculia bacterium]
MATQSRLGVAGWAVLKISSYIVGVSTFGGDPFTNPLFWLLFLAGTGSLLWGCAAQAQLKNYPRALAFIALAGIIGLIAQAVIPPRPTGVPNADAT